jgi:SAM-dependent methyltransferase
MRKGYLSVILREMMLMHLVDYMRYLLQRFRNRKTNKAFRKKNPDIILPPDYILYESFQINYDSYYNQGFDSSKRILDLLMKYKELRNLKILDWGCGPGRLIRHMPELIKHGCEYYGTDYNKKTIEWCSQNIQNVIFNFNELYPPLPYEENFFDIIIGISVFTHLSEELHYAWIKELRRICSKKGILYITTHGIGFKSKLTRKEIRQFDDGNIVIRGKVKQGHRIYTAFQPEKFMLHLVEDFEILEHIENAPESRYIPQDIWIISKT